MSIYHTSDQRKQTTHIYTHAQKTSPGFLLSNVQLLINWYTPSLRTLHLFSLCCLVHTKKQHSPGCSFFPYRPNKQQNVPEGTLKENFPKKRWRITALWDKHTAFLLRNTLRILKGMQKKIGNKKHMLRTWTAVRKGDDFESCICFALKLYAAFILLMNYMHAKSYMTPVRISNCNGFMCLRNIVFHF